MQFVRQVTDCTDQSHRALLQPGECVVHVGRVCREPASETAEGNRQGRQLLVDIVVQFARDARTLGLLCRNQPSRQILNPSIACPQLGFVLPQRLFGALTLDDQVKLCRYRGDDSDESLVLTADDYFDYLIGVATYNHLIPEQVRSAQRDTLLLFLGFQLDDWSFRVLFRSIMRHSKGGSKGGRPRRYGHVAVQLDPEEDRLLEPERARWYLEQYFGKENFNISIYWGNAEDFLRELASEWNKL